MNLWNCLLLSQIIGLSRSLLSLFTGNSSLGFHIIYYPILLWEMSVQDWSWDLITQSRCLTMAPGPLPSIYYNEARWVMFVCSSKIKLERLVEFIPALSFLSQSSPHEIQFHIRKLLYIRSACHLGHRNIWKTCLFKTHIHPLSKAQGSS